MATYTGYTFRHPEAQLLADLTVVENDMELALRWLRPLELGPNFRNLDAEMSEALWSAAVVRYARAFNSGALRWEPSRSLEGLSPELRAFHDWIWELRHGAYAHSVGDVEIPVPVVQIREEDGSRELTAVNCNLSRVVSPGSVDVSDFVRLLQSMLVLVRQRLNAERGRLLEVASSLPMDVLLRDGPWQANPSLDQPKRRRRSVGG